MLKYAPFAAILLLATGCARHGDQPVASAARSPQAASAPGADAQAMPAMGVRSARGLVAGHAFATLQDLGDLVGYPKNPVVRADGAYTWHRANLSEAHAVNAIGGVLRVTAPSGEALQFRYDRHVEHPSGDWTWVGHVAGGGEAEDAVITFGAKAAFGTIAQPGKAPLRLTIRDGVSWLVETDPVKVAAVNNGATRPTRPDFLVPPATSGATVAGKRPFAASAQAAEAAAGSGPVVDLVLGYTSGFAAGLGGQSQAVTRLNNMVQITNEAYANSQISGRVRLVGTVQVSYPDNTSNSDTLEKLTGYNSGTGRLGSPDPAFGELRAARDRYGADLVSLVRKFNDPENDGCGIAWLIGGGTGGNGSIDASDEYFGYSVVSDGRDAGTDGKTYFCREETLAHELGHNMGSQHDKATATKDSKVSYGIYPYSFGYKATAVGGNFYTVMAYGDSGQTSYRLFSNPRTSFCGGRACGIDGQADNARSLSQTIPVVATFRATVVPNQPTPVTGVRGDANADGRADVFWHNPVVQQFQGWFMNGATWTYAPVNGVGSQYRIGTVGDFNGDGRSDILWYDAAKTQLWAWIANADGTYGVSYLRTYPAGWEPVGTGDANGDGRADIFWHSPAAQGMQVWLMNGAAWTYGPVASVGSQYRIASIGDYNGDRLADIIWRDTANTALWEWQAQSTGGYSVVFLRDYPAGWTIVGTGDVNADGKDDLFWHSPSHQGTQPWLMEGTTWSYGLYNGISNPYRVASTGDYNGDGRMDVLWTDGTALWTWQARADGSFVVTYLRGFPMGWTTWNLGVPSYDGGAYSGT